MTPFNYNEQAAMWWRLIRRWWWLPMIFALLSGAVTYAGTLAMIRPVYGASLTMQVVTPSGFSPLTASADAISDALLMTTGPVMEEAARHLGRDARRDPGALGTTICTADGGDRFVTCTSRSRDPLAAAAALNDLARTFIKVNAKTQQAQYEPALRGIQGQEKVLHNEIALLQRRLVALQRKSSQSLTDQYQITALQSQITQDQTPLSTLTAQESTLRSQMLQAATSARVVNPATPNPHQIDPHPLRDALLGASLGIFLGGALVVLLEYLDDRFRSTDELAEGIGLPILTTIRRYDGVPAEMPTITWDRPRSAVAESYRIARTNLQFASVDHPMSVLMVTSSRDSEGKSATTSNMGIAFATAGRKVLLVDADLHRAGLSRAFDLHHAPGLSNALIDPAIGIPAQGTDIPNLSVVPSGPLPPNPAELLGSHRMREWIANASGAYDLLILDTPPILSVSDTREITALADAVVLVVAPEGTSRRFVREARMALDATGARILGIIVNKVTVRSEGYYSYNRYHYSRASEELEIQEPPVSRVRA